MQALTSVQVSRPSHRRTASQWQSLCDAYEGSQFTRKQFCQKHSLALGTFDYWRHKLKKQNAEADEPEPIFVELTDCDDHHHQVESDSGASSPSWAIELQLGDHIVLRLRDAC